MRKFISLLLVLCMALTLCVPAFASYEGEERVVIGANLTEDQILTVYSQFGLIRGSVTELTVTNAEERTYLAGLVSESVIGTQSISCVYIKLLSEGEGMTVTATNINWCTEDMYQSALLTAGIYDAEVKVGAPYAVSGTAALTGIYKAYEDITGTELDEDAKSAAADELVVTAELAEEVDDDDAVAIVSDIKMMADETSEMTDEELEEEIEDIAADYGYELDSETVDKLIDLCRTLEDLDVSELQEKVEQFKDTLASATEYADEASGLWQRIVQFFQNLFDAIRNLFSGDDDQEQEQEQEEEEEIITEEDVIVSEPFPEVEESEPAAEDTVQENNTAVQEDNDQNTTDIILDDSEDVNIAPADDVTADDADMSATEEEVAAEEENILPEEDEAVEEDVIEPAA